VFFGRGYAIRELYERVTGAGGAPIVLLYGQSGVGKSSLLEAGVLPRLEATHTVRYLRRNRTRGLRGTLADGLAAEGSLQDRWQALEEAHDRPLVVVLDQVDEAFSDPDPSRPGEAAELFDELQRVFGIPSERPRGRLLLGFRKEWLLEVEQRCRERGLARAKVALERLDRRGIIEAVEGPARSVHLRQRYGLEVEEGLPGVIADDLLEDRLAPIAPTLQILLTRMWAEATAGDVARPVFDLALYQTLKREGLLLGDFLDRQVAALREWRAELVDSGLALDVLAYHTTRLGTSAQRTAAELAREYRHRGEVMPALVQRCRDLSLLVEPTSTGQTTEQATRLTHDTLAPLVRERFETSEHPGQRARRILDSRAVDWAGGRMGATLEEAALHVVEVGAAGMRAWSADEERLVAGSRKEVERRRRARRWSYRVGVLGLLLVVAAGLLATWQWQQAERQGRIAIARLQTSEAQAVAERYPQRALLLAAEAVRRPLEVDGLRLGGPETVLRSLLGSTGGLPLPGRGGAVRSLAFDP
jgi:hypothetical protein